MPMFRITGKSFEPFEVEVDTHNAAAAAAARLINKDKKIGAYRQTGNSGMSGFYQAYTGGNPQAAVGEMFKVSLAAAAAMGAMSSPAKTSAARKNGKKGGWPKGKPRKPKHASDADK